jgi:hypothetical protein
MKNIHQLKQFFINEFCAAGYKPNTLSLHIGYAWIVLLRPFWNDLLDNVDIWSHFSLPSGGETQVELHYFWLVH